MPNSPGVPDEKRVFLRPSATPLRRLSPQTARGVLVLALLVCASAIALTFSPAAESNRSATPRKTNDMDLYEAVVARTSAGENYYAVAASELPARGFPTTSVFNWRLPTLFRGLAILPSPSWGKVLLTILSVLVVAGAFELLAREDRGLLIPTTAAVLLIGAILLPATLGRQYLATELWAGVLICLSLVAWGFGRGGWSIGLGVAAAFIRELAVLYCLVSCLTALCERRYREACGWAAGIGLWGIFFARHAWNVMHHMPAEGATAGPGWLRFGGAAFLISLTQMNAYLIVLPQAVAAAYLAAAWLGMLGWNTPFGRRTTYALCSYLAAFAAVGREFNQYWGQLIAGLLALAVAHAAPAAVDLISAARHRLTTNTTPSTEGRPG
ncbi:hypothetical protein JCM19992_29270 [Thermostilla marina]